MQLRSGSTMRAYTLGALLIAIPAVGACFWDGHQDEPELVIDSVTMFPASAVLKVGQSVNVVAKPITSSGEPVYNKTYVWTSSDSTIAESRPGGVVVAKKVGSATVTATVDGFKGQTLITVTP